MCEQCLASTIDIMEGEFLPGWYLVMATGNGCAMMRGDYGLVRCNDPDFVIPRDLKPVTDPAFDLSDEQINDMSEEEFRKVEAFEDLVADISGVLRTDLVTSYVLVKACSEAGWDPEIHGWRVEHWLTHQMGIAIAEFEKSWPDGLPDYPAPPKWLTDAMGEMIRMSAEQIPPTTEEDHKRLLDAMDGPIDLSDIPERVKE